MLWGIDSNIMGKISDQSYAVELDSTMSSPGAPRFLLSFALIYALGLGPNFI